MTSPLGFPSLTDVVPVDHHPLVDRYRGSSDGRPVVVEVLAEEVAAERVFVDRHPGLLSPVAVRETDDGRCAVMWPADETLAERMTSNGPLPWHRAAHLVATLADAVAHAHDRGHRHGGIDPHAVQFGPDHQPVLAGFGLAEIRRRAAAMDGDAGFSADPQFSAPEIGCGGDATVAGDIYSLGALLSAALTGGTPASGIDALGRDAPEQLVAVVEKAMASTADARYGTAGDLAAAIRSARDAALYDDEAAVAPEDEAGSDATAQPAEGVTAANGDLAAGPLFVPPPLDTDRWCASGRHDDWAESLDAVVADSLTGLPLHDERTRLSPGIDVDGRTIVTLAEAERGSVGASARRREKSAGAADVAASGRPRTRLRNEVGAATTVADAEAAIKMAESEAAAAELVASTDVAPPAPIASGPPVLVVESGRIELDQPVDGDVLVTGGQLVVRAEIRGSLQVDGGRAVVFAPVTGDVINGGGTVSVEAKVRGRIRGQREFTTVRPGSQS